MSSDQLPTNEPQDDSAAAAAQTLRPRWFSLSRSHTALSATLLLMASTILSRVIGQVRDTYIAWRFGAGALVDSYNAAFQLPEAINYFLVGGVASITFVSILGRYREQGREEEGEAALSAILTMMLFVLGAGILVGELFARSFIAWWFHGFTPEKIDLTTHMTRILLPVQLFFFAGGVLGSVLIVRKQFAYQAVTPLIYNLGIIFGGVAFAHSVGVSGLAWGALLGVALGPFLLNLIGVIKLGIRIRPSLAWNHPGVREWVRLSLPLILGVSLVTFDTWIINHIAAAGDGQIARLNYAKKLFTAPMAILGMAAGAASMPFFAALIGQGKREEFAATVNGSVSRIIAVSMLASAWMIGLAQPLVNVVFRHGALHQENAVAIASYFSLFALSLLCWSAQSIYSRAFYAAGNTLTPMIAGTIVVIASYPLYSRLYLSHGAIGLVAASNIGITIQTLAMAVLLNRTKLVPLRGLQWLEIARTFVVALVSFAALFALRRVLPTGGLVPNIESILAGSVVWLLVCWMLLTLFGSALPRMVTGRLLKRK